VFTAAAQSLGSEARVADAFLALAVLEGTRNGEVVMRQA